MTEHDVIVPAADYRNLCEWRRQYMALYAAVKELCGDITAAFEPVDADTAAGKLKLSDRAAARRAWDTAQSMIL